MSESTAEQRPEGPCVTARTCDYGCLFCKSGHEDRLVDEFRIRYPWIKAIAPSKLRHRRMGGKVIEERVILFPGYVFIRVDHDGPEMDVLRTRYHENVLRVLTYEDGRWQLFGADRALVEALFQENGVIGFSKAYMEGERIRILEGFLKQYEGNIVRVNKRAGTAEIRVRLQDKTISTWLGFEWIEKAGDRTT